MSPVGVSLTRRNEHDRVRLAHVAHLGVGLVVGALSGNFGIGWVLVGFSASWSAEWLWKNARSGGLRAAMATRVARFLWDFAVDLTRSNIQLAWDILTPTDLHKVTLVRVPVDDLTHLQIAFLCHRITLTPGTLACAVDPARTEILVHMMYPSEGVDMAMALRRPIDILKGRA